MMTMIMMMMMMRRRRYSLREPSYQHIRTVQIP